MKGNVVETIGNVTGASSWQQSGKEEHAAGEGEYKAAQAKGYAEGTADRIAGKKDSIVGAVTGDKSQQAEGQFFSLLGRRYKILISSGNFIGNARHDKGETQQDINRNV